MRTRIRQFIYGLYPSMFMNLKVFKKLVGLFSLKFEQYKQKINIIKNQDI